jgi:hypothetical protein
MLRKYNCLDALQSAGISYEDACALRRISMTLHRWFEMECGDSNDYASWGIVWGSEQPEGFVYDEDGKPFKEVHPHKGHTRYYALPDRERGALKRLATIMARYPGFGHYVQGDPRGCALYILDKAQMEAVSATGSSLDSCYNRGIAVHK